MPTYPATALVLRKTKLGETDVILTMLSSDGTQIRAVAKGARKPGSRLGGSVEPFVVCDLLLFEGRNLDVVTEVRIAQAHGVLRRDFDRTVAASVVADLLDKVTAQADPEPVLYGLAEATLSSMERCDPPALPALVTAFLLKAVSVIGFRPSIMACAQCGCTPTDVSAFSHDGGGTLCDACAGIDPGAGHLSSEARDMLRSLLAATMEEAADLVFEGRVAEECLNTVRGFVAYHVPARMRSIEFMSEQMASGTWPSVDSAAPSR